jgi:hypothetical protein
VGTVVVTFEVWVDGVVPEALLVELPTGRVAVLPVHTVLRGSLQDQAVLHEVINRMYGLGLELIEVRRVTAAAAHEPSSPPQATGRPTIGAEPVSDEPRYEVRVRGLLGPVLESALPELIAAPAGPFTLVTGCVAARAGVDAVVGRLSRWGAAVTRIRYFAVEDGEPTGRGEAVHPDGVGGAPDPGHRRHPGVCADRPAENARGWSEPL